MRNLDSLQTPEGVDPLEYWKNAWLSYARDNAAKDAVIGELKDRVKELKKSVGSGEGTLMHDKYLEEKQWRKRLEGIISEIKGLVDD